MFGKKDHMEQSLDHKDDAGHLEEHLAGPVAAYNYIPDTPEEKALVRKIDLHLLPMLWFMYILNYVSFASRCG